MIGVGNVNVSNLYMAQIVAEHYTLQKEKETKPYENHCYEHIRKRSRKGT